MATFTVTNLNDAGAGSLRQAILDANASVGVADTIEFAAVLAGATITLTGGDLAISDDLVIDGDVNGDDKADIAISGNNASRIFNISGAATDVVLASLTLTNGNSGIGQQGGAIQAIGIASLDISDTTIRDSTASGNGGGIYANGGTALTVTRSLITGNTTNNYGGGIYVIGSTATVTNSTVHGNAAEDSGGGISATSSQLTLLNSTITANRSDSDGNGTGDGGGIDRFGGTTTVTVINSVVADNIKGTGSVENDVTSFVDTATNSVFGTAVTIITNNSSLVSVADVGLGALADNGGTVLTRNIVAESVLINAGDTGSAAGLVTDANGDDRVVAGTVDVGATEFQLVVTTASDVVANDGLLSLREAVALANLTADADTITFAAGLAGQTLVLTGGQLTLSNDVTIDGDINGDDVADVILSGNNASRIFNISGATADVDLLSLTLTGGNGGNLAGGAIAAHTMSSLDIVDTTIRNSFTGAYGPGGAIYAASGTLRIVNSLIANNFAGGNGGALWATNSFVTLINTTVHGNSVNGYGGGIYSLGASVSVVNSTITGNRADANNNGGQGGGIRKLLGTVQVTNSVVADNLAGSGTTENDLFGTVDTATNSIFGTTVTITNNFGSTTGVADVGLGQLLDNGGTVLTRSPLDGSVLIGAGANGSVPVDVLDIDNDGNTAEQLPLDGRGGLRIVGGAVDVGAVEQIVDETIGGTAAGDTIIGGLGNDILRGRGGDDTLDGGAGTDTVDYSGATGTGVTVDLGNAAVQFVSATEGSDTIAGIENIIGSSLNDTLTGNGAANVIDGGLGNDTMAGGGGNDTYFDNLGDTISEALNQGFDTINTTRTSLILGPNLERVNFNTNSNVVGTGNSLNNRFQSQGGNDRFVDVLGGADIFSGGAGTDTVDFRSSAAGAVIDMATLVHGGAAAGDSYSGIEKFLGSNTAGDTMTGGGTGRWVFVGGGGGDTLTGGIKNDQLLGQGGNDTLIGGADRDSLDGGTGDDTMTGGSQNDVFVFVDAAFGQDTITDFVDGSDSFKVFSGVATSLADFTIGNNGTTSVTLTLNAAPVNFITINGAAPINITAADFVFY